MSANVALSETFDQWRVKTNELMVMTQTGGTSNFVKLTNAVDSTSNTTGSIITAGGVGIAKSMVVGGDVNVHGNFHANGNITTDGDLTFGSSDDDTVSFSADIGSSLEPNANVTYHIGNNSMYWANGYFEAMNISQADNSGVKALVIDADEDTVQAITVDAEQTTANVFQIDADALTTGTIMYLKSDVNDASTRNLVDIVNEHTSSTGTTALSLRNDAGRGLFIDSNLAAGGYSVEVDSEHTTTNVAKIASIATSGTLLELSASGVLTGDVINITADSATTGKGVNVSMDALTTGSALYIDDDSASTSTRSDVTIIQNNAAALAATALTVQSDGGITGITLDKNFSAVTAATVKGLHVDFDRTVPGSGTANFTDIGIDLDVNSAGLGTTTTTGLDVDVVGATSGTHTVVGLDVNVSGADTMYAAKFVGGDILVGVDGTGHDVTFYGDTASQYMLWDQSADELVLTLDSKLSFWDAAGGENIVSASNGALGINAGTTLTLTAPTITVADGSVDFNIASHDGSNGLKLGGTLVTTTAATLNNGATVGQSAALAFIFA